MSTSTSSSPARFLVIGAGSRGNAYAKAITTATSSLITAVADPDPYKRTRLGTRYIWGPTGPLPGQSFESWTDFVTYETTRRRRAANGEPVEDGVDGVFICVLDEMHKEVVVALAPLRLHIMCEKPLATTLSDCIAMYKALRPLKQTTQAHIFAIGHVLRYSPHTILLRRLLLEKKAIGDILSVVHTEPVGWWHFTHSYVRGNWRREDTTAPSLLTKSCHDIDVILWMLCSPVVAGGGPPHVPSTVGSTGKLQQFRKARKPVEAGQATNCLKCPLGDDGCIYSAKNIYLGPNLQGVESGNTGWPVKIVVPNIETYTEMPARREAMIAELSKDYDAATSENTIKSQNWFGRCVFDGDNDVVDEQIVTITWDDDDENPQPSRLAKTATIHMVAQTKQICQRYSNYYGTTGELYADSKTITVTDFRTGEAVHTPTAEDTGHGGGDTGLARQFALAVEAVKNGGVQAREAQLEYLGCTLEEVLRSHAMVFAAEEARVKKTVVNWKKWWYMEVEEAL